ncbi:MAG: hypothetical protein ABI411_04850 [Tahibacter sp.]
MARVISVAINLAIALIATSGVALSAGPPTATQSVDFHDIQRDGSVAVIGHFGLPIGRIVKIEGRLAKASKVSNEVTLEFRTVNGAAFRDPHWSPTVQVRNTDALPADVDIVVEGYEFLVWRGSAESNWHLDVEFMITQVIAPDRLKLNRLEP